MKIEVAADTEAVTHDPYRVRVRLTNVTDTATDPADQTPIYNPAVAIDKAAEGSNFIFQPGQRFEQLACRGFPFAALSADLLKARIKVGRAIAECGGRQVLLLSERVHAVH